MPRGAVLQTFQNDTPCVSIDGPGTTRQTLWTLSPQPLAREVPDWLLVFFSILLSQKLL